MKIHPSHKAIISAAALMVKAEELHRSRSQAELREPSKFADLCLLAAGAEDPNILKIKEVRQAVILAFMLGVTADFDVD